MTIDDESGEYIAPKPQYLDNLVVQHAELGQCELWKAIAWDTAKLRNYMARADSAGHIDEAARQGDQKSAPPLVADAVVKEAEATLMTRIKDSLDALERRMAALEQRADEEERARRAEEALKLAEDIAETAPKELISALVDRTARLH